MTEKQCKKCKRWLPENKAHFFYSKQGVPYSPCKECRGLRFTISTHKKRKQPTREGFAWCTQCDQELEVVNFTVYKNGRVDASCRSCRQANKKRRREQNPETTKLEDKRQRERWRVERATTTKLWRENNREYVLDYGRTYNKSPVKRIQKLRRRGLRQGLPHTLTESSWNDALQYFDNQCAICGRSRGEQFTLAADHWIPLSAPLEVNPGTVPENIIPLCHGRGGCNNSKGRKMPMDWLIQRFGQSVAQEMYRRIEVYFEYVRSKKV